jgi:hypothetical protein
VAPELLEIGAKDISRAPGRVVSSRWPERIEIISIAQESATRYVVTGFVVEVTSVELVNGGAAAKVPVRIVVEKRKERWVITDYVEER